MISIVLCLLYACQATQETNNESLTLGSQSEKVELFKFDDVEYLFFGYEVTFDEAHVICLNYKAQLAILNTKEKANFIARAMTSTLELGEFWIGAQSDDADSWYWIDRKQKLNLAQTFYGDLKIWESSGSNSNNENCLTVYRGRHSKPTFVPLQCSKKRPFICQREIDRFGTRANEIDVIEVHDEEFTLYSAKATWAEAVVQCRQKGLQIAEVKSKKVAQAVAMSMLRARPDAMENVWIGGYSKDNSWEWLASSGEITVNELWPNDTKLVTGCLLLDRHVCEDPVYVSANCDRKRHILCQKPSIKLISKIPSPINVNGCPYWIGLYPLEWPDARRSCQAVNASLVILDSPKIIDHMMTLMVDYKEELRHIWTDGHRRKNKIDVEKNKHQETWYWSSTGDQVPISGSFIPWCTAQDNTKNTNCLNLDRENHKTPVVYGLNCRKNQSYVCQPWEGHCVSHRVQEDLLKNSEFLNLYSSLADMKTVKMPTIALSKNYSREAEVDVSYVYEDISNMKKLHSTESYYTSSVAYSIPQQVTHLFEETTQFIIDETKKLDEKMAVNYSEDDEGKYDNKNKSERIKSDEVNQTNSQNSITDFLSPLIQFTLPSLPQFGIKVVSADATIPKSEVKEIPVIFQPKGITTRNFTSREKMDNRTQVTKSFVKDSKNTSSELEPNKEGTSKKVISKVINKNVNSTKNVPIAKVKSLVTKKVNIINTPVTTEELDSISSSGLYGNDIDYSDTSLSRAGNTEIIETNEVYDELVKSLEASGKLQSLLNLSLPFAEKFCKEMKDEIKSILKSELYSELKTALQPTPIEFLPKDDFKNLEISNEAKYLLESIDNEHISSEDMDIREDQNIQKLFAQDSIPPYYAFESPLKVELLDNGTGIPISPIVPNSNSNFELNNLGRKKNKFNTTPRIFKNNDDSLDFQLSNFNPHDKNSMLQLGRFLKNMFAGKNPEAQRIDSNFIARRDIPATNQVIIKSENKSLPQKNNLQKTISQNKNDSKIAAVITTTSVTTPPESDKENKILINCQKQFDNLKRITFFKTSPDNLEAEYSQELCQNLSVLLSPAISNINGESSLFNVFKDLMKGIRIDIKETQLKNYVNRFIKERLPNPKEFDFHLDPRKSWHEVFKKILNSLNGTAIRFHGERVQLRIGSFGYKNKSKPKFKFEAHIRTTASPQVHDYTSRGLQTRDEPNDDGDQAQQIKNSWSCSEYLAVNNDPLNDTYESKYPFSPSQSENRGFNHQNKQKMTGNSLHSQLYQESASKVDRQDRLELKLRRRSYLKDRKGELKKIKRVQGRDLLQENQDLKDKMFSRSQDWKPRNLNAEEDLENSEEKSSTLDKMELQISNKLPKNTITVANEEDPFPDFPVINFDVGRVDSFENGFETIRVGRAAQPGDLKDDSSIVSVYIVIKHQNNTGGEKNSLPILELHVRMPENSLPVDKKYNPDYGTGSLNHDQIQDSAVTSNPKSLDSKLIQEAEVTRGTKTIQKSQVTQRNTTPKSQRIPKSREPKIHRTPKQKIQNQVNGVDIKNMKKRTYLNYKNENDFLRKVTENLTNSETVPGLKRRRQLLYLALKYLRHVTDKRFEQQSSKDKENVLRRLTTQNDKNLNIHKIPMPNPNLRIQVPLPEAHNIQQAPMHPRLKSKMVFSPREN